jgi:pyruvate-formate lyase-activating enzyme
MGESVHRLARKVCGPAVQIALYDGTSSHVRLLPEQRSVSLDAWLSSPEWLTDTGAAMPSGFDCRDVVVTFLGAGFFLYEQHPLSTLRQQAARSGVAACGWRSSADLLAWAFRWPLPKTSIPLARALLRLTLARVSDDPACSLESVNDVVWVRPTSGAEHSPAMATEPSPSALVESDASRYLNQALQEVQDEPVEGAAEHFDSHSLIGALLAHRSTSKVPWLFNELVNELEYQAGESDPQGYPPEVHLSVTGACNILCKFCTYDRDIARFEFVSPEQVDRLSFLRYAKILRLHSGLGEPTLNRHLAEIVRGASRVQPHIRMNFFTNGVMLSRPGLIPALVDGGVEWLNVSLNAATPELWREICGADHFHRVTANVSALLAEKRGRRSIHPLVYGSMVLTRRTVAELPRMPSLCRELGIDRFTAFPYFGLGYEAAGRWGSDETYHTAPTTYDAVYDETVREAQDHQVSLEIPLPSYARQTAFGLEVRPLHDFANIARNVWRIGRLLNAAPDAVSTGAYCHFLWRQAAIGSTNRTLGDVPATHYLYPCIGPLSSLNLARKAAFDFPSSEESFLTIWKNDVFTRLRVAQRSPGVSSVCDACRSCDTRDPSAAAGLERLVAEFTEELGLP